MSAWRTLGASLALGLVAALLTGAGVHLAHRASTDGPAVPPPLDRVQAAIEELREDGVHVAPEARDRLSEADEAALEELVATAEVPVRVIVWTPSRHGGTDVLTTRVQLQEAFRDEQSIVVVWERPRADGQVFSTSGYAGVDHPELLGRAADTLPRVVAAAQDAEWWETSADDYWGGRDGGLLAGLLFSLGAVPAVLLLIGLGRRLAGLPFRLPGSWRGSRATRTRRKR